MPTITDPTTDLGTDIALISDLAPVWGLATSEANYLNALLRRLTTPRGGLFYDPDYGFDVPSYLNAAIAQTDFARIRAGIAAELRKDPRTLTVSVDAVFTFATKTMQITVQLTTDVGPFDLVLAASGVTVDLLSVNGVTVAQAQTPANTTVIVGPPGPMGPAGPAGTPGGGGGGGTPQLVLDDPRMLASSSGSEDVLFQWDGVDFGALSVGSITGAVQASAYSGSGTATYKLRIGGSDGVADGTVVATFTHALAAFQTKSASSTFTNPTGLLFVKLTAQSSGVGVDARLKNPVVTFR